MVRILAVPLLVLLAQAAFAQESQPPELVVIDLRPPEEKDGNGLIPLEGKCNDDVFRIADVASDPLKVDVLKSDLAEMTRMLEGRKTLTVLNWSIYYNKQVQQKGGKLGSVGIQGYTIPGKKKERRAGSKCSREASAGGWYEGSELHSVYFPLISEFTGTFGGKPVTARVVFSPRRKLEGRFAGGTDDTEALLETVHETANALAEAIATR